GRRIARIDRDGLLVALHGTPETFYVVAAEELLPEQVLVVRLGAGGAPVLRGGRLQQLQLERLDHRPGDVVLHRKHVGQLAVVGFRPEMVAVGRIDELGADADLVARLAHAALEDGGDVELFPDGGYVLVLALERERRSARGHVQARYLRQQVQQLLAQPVGEVLLLLVGAEIDQRKHRHRGTRRRTRWRGPSHHEVVDGAGRRDEQADACERERHASSKGRAGGALDPPLVDVEDPGQHEHHWKTDRQRDYDVGEH